jgi:hypothetical protein
MVNNVTNINKTKESVHGDGQQCYQYQQTKESVHGDGQQCYHYQQNKRKFTQ